MPMLCLCDGAICTLWVFFRKLGINALKFCKIEARHMLRQCLKFLQDLSLDMLISVILIKNV